MAHQADDPPLLSISRHSFSVCSTHFCVFHAQANWQWAVVLLVCSNAAFLPWRRQHKVTTLSAFISASSLEMVWCVPTLKTQNINAQVIWTTFTPLYDIYLCQGPEGCYRRHVWVHLCSSESDLSWQTSLFQWAASQTPQSILGGRGWSLQEWTWSVWSPSNLFGLKSQWKCDAVQIILE